MRFNVVIDAIIVDKTRTNSTASGNGNKPISKRLGSFTKGVINVVIGGGGVNESGGGEEGRDSFNDSALKRSASISKYFVLVFYESLMILKLCCSFL